MNMEFFSLSFEYENNTTEPRIYTDHFPTFEFKYTYRYK